jgi:hypothetical protein
MRVSYSFPSVRNATYGHKKTRAITCSRCGRRKRQGKDKSRPRQNTDAYDLFFLPSLKFPTFQREWNK